MSISPITFWLILALVVTGMEMLSGTFYMLAFAIGLASGALAAWISLTVPVQISVAAIVSLVSAILLRRWKARHLPPSKDSFLDVGMRVHVNDWRGQKHLQVQHRGCQWDAQLAPGAESGHSDYYIVSIHASTLILHHQPPSEQN